MRSTLGALSFAAFGLLAAAIVFSVGSSPSIPFDFSSLPGTGTGIHTGSLLIGIAVGFVLSMLARVSWTEVPRRTVSWLLDNERNFVRLGWAALFVGILLYY